MKYIVIENKNKQINSSTVFLNYIIHVIWSDELCPKSMPQTTRKDEEEGLFVPLLMMMMIGRVISTNKIALSSYSIASYPSHHHHRCCPGLSRPTVVRVRVTVAPCVTNRVSPLALCAFSGAMVNDKSVYHFTYSGWCVNPCRRQVRSHQVSLYNF